MDDACDFLDNLRPPSDLLAFYAGYDCESGKFCFRRALQHLRENNRKMYDLRAAACDDKCTKKQKTEDKRKKNVQKQKPLPTASATINKIQKQKESSGSTRRRPSTENTKQLKTPACRKARQQHWGAHNCARHRH
jgi:hypothetical protein